MLQLKEQTNTPIYRQLILVTSGNDSTGKAAMAFSFAAHAAALGKEVFVFLTLEASKWAFENYGHKSENECFNRPIENLNNCFETGVRVVVCSTCFEEYNDKNLGSLRKGIEVGKFSDVQEFLEKPCNCLTY